MEVGSQRPETSCMQAVRSFSAASLCLSFLPSSFVFFVPPALIPLSLVLGLGALAEADSRDRLGVLCYSIRLLTPPGIICKMSPCEHRIVSHWIADLNIPANNCSCDCFSHCDARACTCGTRTPPTIEDRRYGDAKRRRTEDSANHGTVKSSQR